MPETLATSPEESQTIQLVPNKIENPRQAERLSDEEFKQIKAKLSTEYSNSLASRYIQGAPS
jgi:hypothetical protein